MVPRVLVLSNECFSPSTSNGRTLGNFFTGWPKDCLAQFFLSGVPDFDSCTHFFQVSDRQALNAITGKDICGGVVKARVHEEKHNGNISQIMKKPRRNACTMLMREAVWSSRKWEKSGFWQWASEFAPEIVLLQAGDCAFMFQLALRVAKKYCAKLVIYSTEGYYFKEFDYFRGTGVAHCAYPLFHSILRRAVQKGYHAADYAIFNCDALNEDFCREFHLKSKVIYTATDSIETVTKKETNKDFVVSYAGNLGVGRPRSLVDIANALQQINPNFYLDVYGTIPDKQTQILFDDCKGICFHGRIPYEEVKQVIRSSDLLVHVESFDPFYVEDLKYAFSTKIADCLASNRCFLMYAPVSFAETKYLLDNNAAYVATSQSELLKILKWLTEEPEMRSRYCANALGLTRKNHDRGTSVAAFQNTLCDLV